MESKGQSNKKELARVVEVYFSRRELVKDSQIWTRTMYVKTSNGNFEIPMYAFNKNELQIIDQEHEDDLDKMANDYKASLT